MHNMEPRTLKGGALVTRSSAHRAVSTSSGTLNLSSALLVDESSLANSRQSFCQGGRLGRTNTMQTPAEDTDRTHLAPAPCRFRHCCLAKLHTLLYVMLQQPCHGREMVFEHIDVLLSVRDCDASSEIVLYSMKDEVLTLHLTNSSCISLILGSSPEGFEGWRHDIKEPHKYSGLTLGGPS